MARAAAKPDKIPEDEADTAPEAAPEAAAGESFRDLVMALDADERAETLDADDDGPEPSLDALLGDAIAGANRDGRHGDSAALHAVAVRLGDFRVALRAAVGVECGEPLDGRLDALRLL